MGPRRAREQGGDFEDGASTRSSAARRNSPRAATLRRIAKALDISIDDLLNESSSSPPNSKGTGPRGVGRRGSSDEANFADTIAVENRGGAGATNLREQELTRKLHEILNTPLGEAVARMVEETHRVVASYRHLQAH